MKTLIVEDDFTSRVLMQELLKSHGPAHVAVNGKEAVEAVRLALEANDPYDLVCMDIMMPELDGQQALKQIRALEDARGIPASKRARIVMTTALADRENVMAAVRRKCDHFLAKPIRKEKLLEVLRELELIA